MAIVLMKRLSLIGLNSERDEILRELAWAGCVEISDQSHLLADPEYSGLFAKTPEQIDRLEGDAEAIKSALTLLSARKQGKKPLFERKPVVGRGELESADISAAVSLAAEINKKARQIEQLKSLKDRLNGNISMLEPWRGFDLPLNFAGTGESKAVFGTLPASIAVSELEKLFDDAGVAACVFAASSDANLSYIMIQYHRSDEEKFYEIAREQGFSRLEFKDYELTADEEILKLHKSIDDADSEIAKLSDEVGGYLDDYYTLSLAHDAISIELAAHESAQRLLKSGNIFLMTGYVPDFAEKKTAKILDKFECAYEFMQPSPDDDVPVYLSNRGYVRHFEAITELFGLPKYDGIDPDAIMAPFYILFFGMMFGDVGYGLILMLACAFALKKLNLQGMTRKMAGVFAYCGASAVIWGVIFGSWFGDAINVVAKVFFHSDFTMPALLDPLKDPIIMLGLSLLFGLIHLFAGMGVSAYMMIKQRRWLDALFDIGFWYLLLSGLPMMLASGIVGEIGKWLALAGSAGLVLTQGRSSKNIFAKIFKGVGSLYNVIGYFADVLSYSRILALGLATGVIASVINTMGSLFGQGVLGIIVFAVIFIFGHVFNFGINILGTFVHTSRLQFVEFFGKFYESGGRAFQPLNIRPKYVEISLEKK